MEQYCELMKNYNAVYDRNLRYALCLRELEDRIDAYEMVYGPLAVEDPLVDENLEILDSEDDEERFVDRLSAIYTSKKDPKPTPTPHPWKKCFCRSYATAIFYNKNLQVKLEVLSFV